MEKNPLAVNYVVINFNQHGLNMWASDKPIENPNAGFSNEDIPKCGYRTFRVYAYGDSKTKHIESATGTDWDPIPSCFLDIWSKRGI